MKTFYTLTNNYTEYTNSRSKRYMTINEAVLEAQRRITNKETDSVIILKAIEVVMPETPRIVPVVRMPTED